MFIRTERLFLRPGWPEDLDDLIEAFGEATSQRTVAVAALPQTNEAIREYLQRPRDPRLPQFFMYLRDDDGARMVGGIGLGRNREDVEIGYWISSAFRGRGFALESLRAVVEQARTLGHKRLVARHCSDDAATARVLEAVGFVDCGSEGHRYSAGRRGEAVTRLFAIELERSFQPVARHPDQALTA